MIQIKNLSFQYAQNSPTVLRNFSVSLSSKKLVGVFGPNGSGKTTLFQILAGLTSKKSKMTGEVLIQGQNLHFWAQNKNLLSYAKTITYVPGGIFSEFPIRVNDFVAQGRFPYHSTFSLKQDSFEHSVKAALASVSLESMAHRPFFELSSGEKQLCLLARALVQDAKIFLIDETTSQLDLDFQERAFRILKKIAEKDCLVMVICHDINNAIEYCDEMIWLKNGELIQHGTVAECLNEKNLKTIYPGVSLAVGQNPFTKSPKLFRTGEAAF